MKLSFLIVAAALALAAQTDKASSGEIRKQIKAALFVPDPAPKLAPVSNGKFEPEPGVIAERVTYATEFGLRVPAIVYRPKKNTGKLPALIVVNGHGGDKYTWYAFYSGMMYARAGAVVLTYDPIGEGERNSQRKSGTRAHDKLVQPAEMGRRMGGLMMTDVMQAVSYLSQRPDVDPSRIGAMGYSMGSFVLSLACAVETRLRACVLVGGGNIDGPGEYWDRSKPMCQGLPYQSLQFLGDRPAVLYSLHPSTLIFNGLEDTVVDIPVHHMQPFFEDMRQRTIRRRGGEDGVFEYRFEPGTSHRPYFVTRPVALWLRNRLQFPNWTEEDIRKMPATHISEWAKENHAPMDALYATEQREGGAMALGTGIPVPPRDDLNAVPPAEWQRDQEKYVLESWIKEALSRVKP
jgi:dienelactone hydrolase